MNGGNCASQAEPDPPSPSVDRSQRLSCPWVNRSGPRPCSWTTRSPRSQPGRHRRCCRATRPVWLTEGDRECAPGCRQPRRTPMSVWGVPSSGASGCRPGRLPPAYTATCWYVGSIVWSWQGGPIDGFVGAALLRLAVGPGVRVVRLVVRPICAGWLPHDGLSGWSARGSRNRAWPVGLLSRGLGLGSTISTPESQAEWTPTNRLLLDARVVVVQVRPVHRVGPSSQSVRSGRRRWSATHGAWESIWLSPGTGAGPGRRRRGRWLAAQPAPDLGRRASLSRIDRSSSLKHRCSTTSHQSRSPTLTLPAARMCWANTNTNTNANAPALRLGGSRVCRLSPRPVRSQ